MLLPVVTVTDSYKNGNSQLQSVLSSCMDKARLVGDATNKTCLKAGYSVMAEMYQGAIGKALLIFFVDIYITFADIIIIYR